MADKYGTDCGVKGMKNYLHIFIKGAFVLFLIAYLTVLYTSDSAKNVPMEQIAQTMEQDSDITSLNKEARSDLKHFGKGIWKLASILIGIIVGYLVSIPFGMVDFSSIGEAGVCQLPSLMHFGVQFEPSSCVALGILFAINSIQAIGDYSATTIGAMDRTPKDDELQRGIVGYGLSNVVGALLGGLPTATYSQNVGIVTTTKVINRWVLGLAAAILGIAGLVPKFSAILTTIPQCVLGGATVSVFASIAMTGMKLVASAEMDYRNSSIVGLAAALGMGVSQATAALASFPTWVTTIFGKSPVVLATIIAVMLNVILPKTRDEQKEEAKKKIKIEQKLEEDHREFGK